MLIKCCEYVELTYEKLEHHYLIGKGCAEGVQGAIGKPPARARRRGIPLLV